MSDMSGVIGSLCASRALCAKRARLLAIFGITVGLWAGSDAVSRTLAVDLVRLEGWPSGAAVLIWLSALAGCLTWVSLARRWGIPTSSTHALVGALSGATLMGTGDWGRVNWGVQAFLVDHQLGGILKVFLALVVSPLLGSALGFMIFRLLARCLRQATARINEALRRLEVAMVLLQSVSYGCNDAHTVLGVFAGVGICLGPLQRTWLVNWPARMTVSLGLAAGVMLGSTAIMRTMGRGLYLVRPAEALAGQAAAALAVFGAAGLGAPVSSSQITSSALIGAGGAWRPHHVRWRRVRDVLLTWVVTFPSAAVLGGLFEAILLTGVG